MYALTGALLHTSRACLQDYALLIEGNKIVDWIHLSALSPAIDTITLPKGTHLAPGFIDLQLNGCGGVLFNDAISQTSLDIMHQTNLRSGTTSFLPTLITAPNEDMLQAISVVDTAMRKAPHSILGLHLEGPYINPLKKGIHNPTYIRAPDPVMVNHLLKQGNSTVKLITLAPEQVDPTTIAALADSGIVVSAGHSFATYEQAMTGFAAGISMATHLFNTMSPLESRKPGIVGAVLDYPGYASVIVDGLHVDYAVLRLAKRLKQDKLFLITDAVSPVGTNMHSFEFGGQTVLYKNGQCITPEGTLGGSALTMINAVKNCVNHLDITLEEALRMASRYPAEILQLTQLGCIEKNYIANLVVFDDAFKVQAVVEQGQLQWIDTI